MYAAPTPQFEDALTHDAGTKLEVAAGHSLHHVVCPHDCPDTCSMLVTRNDRSGKAVAVHGDPTHPITRGYLCNKVNHYLDLVDSDKRVLYPHRRVGPKGPCQPGIISSQYAARSSLRQLGA